METKKNRNNEFHLRSLRGGGEIADIEPRNSRGEFLRNFWEAGKGTVSQFDNS